MDFLIKAYFWESLHLPSPLCRYAIRLFKPAKKQVPNFEGNIYTYEWIHTAKKGLHHILFLLKVVNETDEAKKAAEDEEAKTMTLDEWKAQQGGSKDQPKFNIRKAGEGSDLDPKWKKTYAYKKEKETHEDDEDEVKKLYFEIIKFDFVIWNLSYVQRS